MPTAKRRNPNYRRLRAKRQTAFGHAPGSRQNRATTVAITGQKRASMQRQVSRELQESDGGMFNPLNLKERIEEAKRKESPFN